MANDFPNLNDLWSFVLAETLAQRGLRHAVICPGSRSSPLAFAFARQKEIDAISILDERSASFFAMGLAKRLGQPVAIVCTSGTAAANFYSAIIEASESALPMIVLTADRPPELRDCAAGQTIDQVKMYSGFPRWTRELALPENDVSALRYLRQTMLQAYDRAVAPVPGPIHVNVPFREPLPPIPLRGGDWQACLGREEAASLCRMALASQPVGVAEPPADVSAFVDTDRGLLIVGPNSAATQNDEWRDNLSKFAGRLRWPVLSDALNPLRSRASQFEDLVVGHDVIVRCGKKIAHGLRPSKAIVVGELPTSKATREWLTTLDLEILFLDTRRRNIDPTHSRSRMMYHDFRHGVPTIPQREGDPAFRQGWREADAFVRRAFDERLAAEDTLFEGKVSRCLFESMPAGASLFVSNGLPPRDMEFFSGTRDSGLDVYFNRGGNGIDGILSTAMGIAYAGQPTVLLTGDLALLHDSNGGLFGGRHQLDLTVVVLNNAGGGIFELLPVARFGEIFEKYFATPQDIDFEQWARLYGFQYTLIESWPQLAQQTSELAGRGLRLLEVRADRKADAAKRKDWIKTAARELEERL